MKKKLFSVLLALVMCLSLLPTMAFATPFTEIFTWDALQNAVMTSCNIKLMDDITSDDQLTIPAGKTVTIDLNGHTLDRGLAKSPAADNGRVILVQGSLTIEDSSSAGTGAITGGNCTYGGGGIYVADAGILTLNGGAISSNKTNSSGGGVYTDGSATFKMVGGSIVKNTAGAGGGGVFARGTFEMTKGLISANVAAVGAGGVYIYGSDDSVKRAAISVRSKISGGTISYNQAGSSGGGIFVDYYNAYLDLSGATIINNTAAQCGGGIYCNRSNAIKVDSSVTLKNNNAGVFFTANMYSPTKIIGNTNGSAAFGWMATIVVRYISNLFGL